MGDVIKSTQLILPTTYLSKIHKKVNENAVIPALIPQRPMFYRDEKSIFLTEKPVAQYVQPVEGGEKHTTDFAFGEKSMKRFKVQATIRMTEDTYWANEDNTMTEDQLNVVLDEMGESIGQAVDAGMIHQFDPWSKGLVTDAATVALTKVGTPITATSDLLSDVDSLIDPLLLAGYNANGIAMDTMWANDLRKQRNTTTSAKLFPEVPMRVNTMGSFEGLNAVVSGNVSGRPFIGLGDTGVRAIIGDFSQAQWGIVRNVAMRRFDVGDPDNRGYDLSYKNEIAFRLEVVFAFGLYDEKAFAIYKGTPYTTTPTTPSKPSEGDETPGGDNNGGDDDDNIVEPQSVKSTKATK